MTETRQSGGAPSWAQFNQLLLAVLPVRSLRDLVSGLSEVWQELTDAVCVLVATPSADGTRIWTGLSAAAGSPQCFDCQPAESDDSHLKHVLGALQGEPDFEIVLAHLADGNSQTLPFHYEGRRIGWATLFLRSSQSLRAEFLSQAAELSGRLIAQGLLQERHGFAGDAGALLEAAKLESLAEFAAGAGHEINNPLTTISGRVQLLLRDETDPERRQALETIGGQAYRIRDMIGDVMLFGRPPEPNPQPLDLTTALHSVLDRLKEEAESRGCTFELHAEDAVEVFADSVQLSVVISSLIRNSLEAMIDGGPITITVCSVVERDRRFGLLSVADRGPGLSDIDRKHLFDPFYSGRQAGRGLGFGLSKCWRIVSTHRGRIEVESIPDQETTFKVYWPAETR